MEQKEIKLHTKHSLCMLSCILERIAVECRDNPDKKPEWYSEMASSAVMLADYINHIENGDELHDEYDNDDSVGIELVSQ